MDPMRRPFRPESLYPSALLPRRQPVPIARKPPAVADIQTSPKRRRAVDAPHPGGPTAAAPATEAAEGAEATPRSAARATNAKPPPRVRGGRGHQRSIGS